VPACVARRPFVCRALIQYFEKESVMSDVTQTNPWWPRARLVFFCFAAIGAFLLVAEHRAHLVPYLPFFFLAACPLMHLFMHHGHGHHHHGGNTTDDTQGGRP
jgi:hypothetical protein